MPNITPTSASEEPQRTQIKKLHTETTNALMEKEILHSSMGKMSHCERPIPYFIHLGICNIYLQHLDVCASLPKNLKGANYHREVKIANFILPQKDI